VGLSTWSTCMLSSVIPGIAECSRATMLGMPANLAKDAVSLNPKLVLLKARKYEMTNVKAPA